MPCPAVGKRKASLYGLPWQGRKGSRRAERHWVPPVASEPLILACGFGFCFLLNPNNSAE